MELECDPDKEFNDIFVLSCYTKHMTGDDEVCLICHDANNTYDKYKLTCNHTYHTRCYRRYCFYKDAVKCPLCFDIKPYEEEVKKLKEYYDYSGDKNVIDILERIKINSNISIMNQQQEFENEILNESISDLQDAVFDYHEFLKESILKHKEALKLFKNYNKNFVEHIKYNLKFDISVKLFLYAFLDGDEYETHYDNAKKISKKWLEISKTIGKFSIIENNTISKINEFQRCANDIFDNPSDFDIIQEVESGIKIYTL